LRVTNKSNGRQEVWNKGQTIGQKRPLTKKEIRAISSKLKSNSSMRDLILFNLAIDSSLGASDLVRLQLKDVAYKGEIASKASVISRQTNNEVQFEISEETRELIAAWVEEKKLKPGNYLFASRISDSPHISARQYSRMVADWMSLIGLDPKDYSAQSLRRTKPMLIYGKTKDLGAAMSQLGHARLRSTIRFLGIE
jgi:integrase